MKHTAGSFQSCHFSFHVYMNVFIFSSCPELLQGTVAFKQRKNLPSIFLGVAPKPSLRISGRLI